MNLKIISNFWDFDKQTPLRDGGLCRRLRQDLLTIENNTFMTVCSSSMNAIKIKTDPKWYS